ncbi:ankyrin repeat-containing domain protein [Biscogniauxia mediterranea]|nr:ankyrin repeat-containing domain protein [Biscogniauxia mediterranea]
MPSSPNEMAESLERSMGSLGMRQHVEEPASIINIPIEVILHITSFLGTRDLGMLARSCKDLHACLNSTLYKRDLKEEDFHALWWACQHQSLDALQMALTYGDVNHHFMAVHTSPHLPPSEYMHTALSVAVRVPSPVMVEALLQRGIDVNRGTLTNPQGVLLRTALNEALDWEHAIDETTQDKIHQIVRLLLKYGANPNADDRLSQKVPIIHALSGNISMDTFQHLLFHGANILGNNLVQVAGSSPVLRSKPWTELIQDRYMNYAAWQYPAGICVRKFRLVLEDIPINLLRDEYGNPIILSILRAYDFAKSHVLIRIAIELGADPNLKPTPAFRYDVLVRTVGLMLDVHTDGNHYFYRLRQLEEVFVMLLSAGADPNNVPVLSLVTSLGNATFCVRALLNHGARVNYADSLGVTALHLACARAFPLPDCVRALLERGAAPNAADASGRTPMHYACSAPMGANWGARSQIVQLLMRHGGRGDVLDMDGVTPRGYAAFVGDSFTVLVIDSYERTS